MVLGIENLELVVNSQNPIPNSKFPISRRMNKNSNIIVTGAAGFIGSYLAGYLNREGYNNLILVDDFADDDKKPNWINKKNHHLVEREELFAWLESDPEKVDFVFHLGART